MSSVVALVDDLFFQSRVRAASPPAVDLQFLLTMEDVLGASRHHLALVDLDARVDAIEAIRLLKSHSAAPIIAFGPHVATERRQAARAAGADRVLAKSKFVTELPRLMSRAAGANR